MLAIAFHIFFLLKVREAFSEATTCVRIENGSPVNAYDSYGQLCSTWGIYELEFYDGNNNLMDAKVLDYSSDLYIGYVQPNTYGFLASYAVDGDTSTGWGGDWMDEDECVDASGVQWIEIEIAEETSDSFLTQFSIYQHTSRTDFNVDSIIVTFIANCEHEIAVMEYNVYAGWTDINVGQECQNFDGYITVPDAGAVGGTCFDATSDTCYGECLDSFSNGCPSFDMVPDLGSCCIWDEIAQDLGSWFGGCMYIKNDVPVEDPPCNPTVSGRIGVHFEINGPYEFMEGLEFPMFINSNNNEIVLIGSYDQITESRNEAIWGFMKLGEDEDDIQILALGDGEAYWPTEISVWIVIDSEGEFEFDSNINVFCPSPEDYLEDVVVDPGNGGGINEGTRVVIISVVVAVIGVAILIILIFLWRRRRHKHQNEDQSKAQPNAGTGGTNNAAQSISPRAIIPEICTEQLQPPRQIQPGVPSSGVSWLPSSGVQVSPGSGAQLPKYQNVATVDEYQQPHVAAADYQQQQNIAAQAMYQGQVAAKVSVQADYQLQQQQSAVDAVYQQEQAAALANYQQRVAAAQAAYQERVVHGPADPPEYSPKSTQERQSEPVYTTDLGADVEGEAGPEGGAGPL